MNKKMLKISMTSTLLIASFGLWGCADRSVGGESPETSVQQGVESSQPVAAGSLSEIDREEASSYLRIEPERLSEQAQEAWQRSAVPVLLPDDDDLLESAHITVGPAWYAASMRGADHTVLVNGTNQVHEIPGISGEKEGEGLLPEGHSLTRTHGIVSLSFEAFGVAYAIDVECENPLENPLCAEDDYVLSLAEGAGVVGER